MKKLLLSLLTFAAITTFGQKTAVINDPDAVERNIEKGFSAIQVSSGIDLFLTQGDEEAIAVSASDEKYLDGLKTEVVNSTLKIYYDSKGFNWTTGDKKKLKAYVSFKTLVKLKASAGSRVSVNGIIKTSNLNLNVSSGADFKGELDVTGLTVDLSSGSGADISGRAEKLIVDVSSGAHFKGYDFEADFCDAKASSGASVNITVNKELDAKANSGGNIRYKGEAVIKDIKINGGGAIKKA